MKLHVKAESCRALFTAAVSVLGLALLLNASSSLNAQAVAQPTGPEKAAPANDEVITMSAFTVSTKKTNDYIASETVTGTRLATLVRDLPFQVNIVTSEFIGDFAAYDLGEQLGYTSNFSPTPGSGAPILRGFSTVPYVDGFRRISGAMPADVDTDTTTVIKGPAASIYGQTVPGGVVNRTIKHPGGKQQSGIKLALGSNETSRASAFTTGPLSSNNTMFYRVSVENDYREYDQMYADQHTTYVGGQFLWKPSSSFSWNTRIGYNEDHNHERTALPSMKNSMKNVISGAPKYTYVSGTNSDGSPKTSTADSPFVLSLDPYQNSPEAIQGYTDWVNSGYTNGYIAPAQLQRWNKWTGLDYDMKNYRADGKLGETYNRWLNVNTFAEKRWSDFISTKASLDYFDRGYHKQSGGGNQSYAPNPDALSGSANVYDKTPGRYDNGTIGTGNPQWTDQPFKNLAFQVDNVLSFKTGPVDHKLLLTFDYNELDQSYYTIRYKLGSIPLSPTPVPIYHTGALGADLPIGYTPRLVPLSDNDFWYPTYDKYPECYDTQATLADYDSLTRDFGFFISERASMFKNRLRAYVGLRYDYIKNHIADRNIPRTTPSGTVRDSSEFNWTTSSWTPQVGISAAPARNVVVFANFSTAYQPIAQYKTKRDSDGMYTAEIFPNEESYGYEFGVRYTAFKERLNATLSYFYIDRQNVLNSYTDPETNLTNYDTSGEQDARGFDFDFNWVITSSFQVGGSWGYNDAQYVACGLPYLIGTPTPGAVRNNYGLNARYSFKTGIIKGISVGGGIKYYEKSMVSPGSGIVYYSGKYPNFYNVRMPNGQLPFPDKPENAVISTATNPQFYPQVNVSDGRDTIYNQPYSVTDFWIKYNFRKSVYGHRTDHTIQVNLKNAFDRFYTYGSATVGDSRQIIVTYSLTF